MIKFSKDKVLLLHRLIAWKQAAVSVSGMKPCWIPHWRTPLPALTGRSSILPRRKRAHGSAIRSFPIISFVDGNGHYRLNQPQDE